MSKMKLFFICAWVFIGVTVLWGYVINLDLRADNKTNEKAQKAVRGLYDYFQDKKSLPDSLDALPDDPDVGGLTYKRTDKQSYSVCVNYRAEYTDPYDEGNKDKLVKIEGNDTYVMESHPKGEVCYVQTVRLYEDQY